MMMSGRLLAPLQVAGAVLVLLLSASTGITGVVYEDTLYVDGSEAEYGAFMDSFYLHVNQTAARYIEGHPVLKPQGGTAPPADWVHVHLKEKKPAGAGAQVTLAIRCDNLYVLGFQNRFGWFAFQGQKALLPSSTELSFDGGYNQLFDKKRGGYEELKTLRVNSGEAVVHFRKMANFQPADVAAGRDAQLKRTLAFFVLVVSESDRFWPIRSAVAGVWVDKNAHLLPFDSVLKLVVNWKEFSCAVISWDKFGRTPAVWGKIPEAKIIKPFAVNSAQDALSQVRPLLQSTRCKNLRPTDDMM